MHRRLRHRQGTSHPGHFHRYRRWNTCWSRFRRSDIRRRKPDSHARELTTQCLVRFKSSGSSGRCLTVTPQTGDDNVAETTRLHVLTHPECYDRVLLRVPVSRKDRATLAEFKVMNDDQSGDITRHHGIIAHGARLQSVIADGGNVLEYICRSTVRFLTLEGLDQAMLYVDETNERAIHLYQKLGFARWSTDVLFRRG